MSIQHLPSFPFGTNIRHREKISWWLLNFKTFAVWESSAIPLRSIQMLNFSKVSKAEWAHITETHQQVVVKWPEHQQNFKSKWASSIQPSKHIDLLLSSLGWKRFQNEKCGDDKEGISPSAGHQITFDLWQSRHGQFTMATSRIEFRCKVSLMASKCGSNIKTGSDHNHSSVLQFS